MKQLDEDKKYRVGAYYRGSYDHSEKKRHYYELVQSRPNWELVGIYADERGDNPRIAMRQLIEDVEAGKVNLVITKSFTSLAFNTKGALEITNAFRNMPDPVGVLFETEELYSLDPDFDQYITIYQMLAEEERRNKTSAMIINYKWRFAR